MQYSSELVLHPDVGRMTRVLVAIFLSLN
jgi:hypothetical protein